MEVLSGGEVIALSKPNGGVRPIIPQDIFLRITGRAAAKQQRQQIAKVLEPLQLGVATSCGTELIARAVDWKLKADPSSCCLKLDLENGYILYSPQLA